MNEFRKKKINRRSKVIAQPPTARSPHRYIRIKVTDPIAAKPQN